MILPNFLKKCFKAGKTQADPPEKNDAGSQLTPKKESRILTLSTIPPRSLKSSMASEFHQEIRGIGNLPIQYLTDRYADILWKIFDALTLHDREIEALILPVISHLYEYCHLLPASEYHHHAHVGGLIRHSLEVSAYCAGIARETRFPKAHSSLQQYDESPKWITAAAVMGLIHDCGKVFDVECSGINDGCIWNPHQCGLKTWLDSEGLTNYYVRWRPDRQHGSHELRSLRLAFLHILPEALERHFGEQRESLLMSAVEEAVVFKRGPLAEILKQSEALSIEADQRARQHTFSCVNTIPLPPVRAAVAAVSELLRTQSWSVNSDKGPLWLGAEGLFLLLSPQTLSDIREMAKVLGNSTIPASSDGFVEILKDSGMLKTARKDGTAAMLWQISLKDRAEPMGPCLCLTDPSLFLQGRPAPEAAELVCTVFEGQRAENPAGTPKDHPSGESNSDCSHGLLAPNFSFTKGRRTPESREQQERAASTEPDQKEPAEHEAKVCGSNSRSSGSAVAAEPAPRSDTALLSEAELRLVSEKAMPPPEAKTFLERLISTLIVHMQTGGTLASNRKAGKNGLIICSADEVMKVLKNRKLEELSLKTLIKVRRASPRLCFDDRESEFRLTCLLELNERTDNQTKERTHQ